MMMTNKINAAIFTITLINGPICLISAIIGQEIIAGISATILFGCLFAIWHLNKPEHEQENQNISEQNLSKGI